jgi:hypothetical protein
VISHSGGRRAGAIGGGDVGSPKCERISRTAQASVMKAMIRISPPQRGQTSGKTSSIRASSNAQA